MNHPSVEIMTSAINLAKEAQKESGYAVAAIVTKGEEIISEGFASVILDEDPTCHAEINAIRNATKKLKSRSLAGCHIYTTLEPCPMCASAMIWARLEGVVFGALMEDQTELHRIMIKSSEVFESSVRDIKSYPGFMRDECVELF